MKEGCFGLGGVNSLDVQSKWIVSPCGLTAAYGTGPPHAVHRPPQALKSYFEWLKDVQSRLQNWPGKDFSCVLLKHALYMKIFSMLLGIWRAGLVRPPPTPANASNAGAASFIKMKHHCLIPISPLQAASAHSQRFSPPQPPQPSP
jgi:hypothetical protein